LRQQFQNAKPSILQDPRGRFTTPLWNLLHVSSLQSYCFAATRVSLEEMSRRALVQTTQNGLTDICPRRTRNGKDGFATAVGGRAWATFLKGHSNPQANYRLQWMGNVKPQLLGML
jgi:hypothetical protein